jgi:hypothetical protein
LAVKVTGKPALTVGAELLTVTVYACGVPVTLTKKTATTVTGAVVAPAVRVEVNIGGDGESIIVRVSV